MWHVEFLTSLVPRLLIWNFSFLVTCPFPFEHCKFELFYSASLGQKYLGGLYNLIVVSFWHSLQHFFLTKSFALLTLFFVVGLFTFFKGCKQANYVNVSSANDSTHAKGWKIMICSGRTVQPPKWSPNQPRNNTDPEMIPISLCIP